MRKSMLVILCFMVLLFSGCGNKEVPELEYNTAYPSPAYDYLIQRNRMVTEAIFYLNQYNDPNSLRGIDKEDATFMIGKFSAMHQSFEKVNPPQKSVLSHNKFLELLESIRKTFEQIEKDLPSTVDSTESQTESTENQKTDIAAYRTEIQKYSAELSQYFQLSE